VNWSTALSLALSATAIAVTISLAVVTAGRQRRASEAARRSRITELLVEAVERAFRLNARPALLRVWRDPATEAALLVPRLLKQLGHEDKAVERWALQQVALQLREPQRKVALQLQVDLTMKLLEWERGARPTSWFEEAGSAGDLDFGVSKSLRRQRSRSLALELFGNALGGATLVALLGRVWRLL
jgi:transcriptional regulator of met regulon